MATLGKLLGWLAVAASIAVLAACGGDDASSDPNSADYDPAETTLQDAGLEVCSEQEEQIAQSTVDDPGLVEVRVFDVAKDCMGEESSPNVVTMYLFEDRNSVDAGFQTVKQQNPQGEVSTSGAVVVLATGPQKAENMAAIERELQESTSGSTTTG